MHDHWRAGYNDTVHTLRHPEVLERPQNVEGSSGSVERIVVGVTHRRCRRGFAAKSPWREPNHPVWLAGAMARGA